MNDNKSFIKLHRKFLNWEWYKDSNTKDLFIHCLLKANWKDAKFEGQIIKRGSFVTSVKALSDELSDKKHKVSIQSIRTSLKHLFLTNELTINTTNKYTVITINNYEQYQYNNKQINNQLTNNQQTTNKQLTTIEEYKEYKNINNINNSSYEFVEKEFGRLLSPVEIETLSDWEKRYGADKIKLAFKESTLNGVRNFKYTQKILDAWKNLTIEEIKRESKPVNNLDLFDYDWLNEED